MNQYKCTPISPEQELEIVDLFLNTATSLRDIAKRYNRKSYEFIYSILSKHNVDKKRRHISNKISLNEISQIIKLYQEQRMSIRQIAKLYNVAGDTINHILIQNGIAIRDKRKYVFNEYYFDAIDSANKAYLLGFLYADGCVNKNNVVSFTVHKNDREILEMYVSELQATNPIAHVKSHPHVRIAFSSKHMCDTLISMGCGRNKTYTLKFPSIPKAYYYDFIRGFMDGDGCISVVNRGSNKYISLSFTGTKEMMEALKCIFQVDNRIAFYRNAYTLHIGKHKDVLRILDNIYNNAELYMSRKFKKYCEYLTYIHKEEMKNNE